MVGSRDAAKLPSLRRRRKPESLETSLGFVLRSSHIVTLSHQPSPRAPRSVGADRASCAAAAAASCQSVALQGHERGELHPLDRGRLSAFQPRRFLQGLFGRRRSRWRAIDERPFRGRNQPKERTNVPAASFNMVNSDPLWDHLRLRQPFRSVQGLAIDPAAFSSPRER
jgi:hypothetical protein